MGNEVAAAINGPDRQSEVGADVLAEGLLLVRASAIKVVRFQLAMERQDRRLALETVDDLVLLDRKIEDFLTDMPRASQGVSALERELQAQRQALAQEKFTLAAGTARGSAKDGLGPRDDMKLPSDPNLGLIGPVRLELRADDDFTAGRPSKLLATGIVLALLALTVAGFFFLADSGTPFAQFAQGAFP